MTSYTSSFNKFFIISAVALGLLIEFIASSIYPTCIDYTFRDQINAEKPDIVFLGSSPLRDAVKKDSLEKDLKDLENKTYQTLTLMHLHSGGSYYWYLVLRNQICEANYKMKVGLVLRGDDLTTWADVSSPWEKNLILKQLRKGEYLLSKKGSPSLYESLLDNLVIYRNAVNISQDLKNLFVSNLLIRIAPSIKADEVLDKRFNERAFTEGEDYFNQPDGMQYDFDNELKGSYLPEIIALKNQYKIDLFFVALPVLPRLGKGVSYEQKRLYFEKLKNYLESNGVKYISFWDDPRLNKKEFFKDQMHMKNNVLFNELLAQGLIAKGIVK